MIWKCATCGQTFSAWAPCQRHVDTEHGGARIDSLDLEQVRDGEATDG